MSIEHTEHWNQRGKIAQLYKNIQKRAREKNAKSFENRENVANLQAFAMHNWKIIAQIIVRLWKTVER